MLVKIVKTLIVYTFLVVTMRILGKRQIGEMQLSELVTTLLLSEIAALPIADGSVSVLDAAVPIAVIVVLEIVVSFLVTKFNPLKLIFDGRPSILIYRGKLNMREMKRLRLTIDELLSELRQKDIFDIRRVDYALLEHNGKLSVANSEGENGKNTAVAYTLAVDGRICDYSIKNLGISEKDVLKMLSDRGAELKEVLILTLDGDGNVNMLRKDEV